MTPVGNVLRVEKDLSIALCTCEGSLFLPAQLESLAGQTLLPGELVVCDDASTDNTVALVEQFARQAPFEVKLYVNKERLGVVKNFGRAIEKCGRNYLALCDQDDVWQNVRLEYLMRLLKSCEFKFGNIPLLVHSDLVVIDKDGRVVAESYMKMRRMRHQCDKKLPRLIAQNFITGNTVLFNSELKKMALPIPDEALMHDWWLALVASACGEINYCEYPTVYYRQHESNVIGAKHLVSTTNIRRYFFNMEQELASRLKQAYLLKVTLNLNRNNPATDWLNNYLASVSQGGFRAVISSIKYRVLMQGIIRNLFFMFLLLKGNYKKFLGFS